MATLSLCPGLDLAFIWLSLWRVAFYAPLVFTSDDKRMYGIGDYAPRHDERIRHFAHLSLRDSEGAAAIHALLKKFTVFC